MKKQSWEISALPYSLLLIPPVQRLWPLWGFCHVWDRRTYPPTPIFLAPHTEGHLIACAPERAQLGHQIRFYTRGPSKKDFINRKIDFSFHKKNAWISPKKKIQKFPEKARWGEEKERNSAERAAMDKRESGEKISFRKFNCVFYHDICSPLPSDMLKTFQET